MNEYRCFVMMPFAEPFASQLFAVITDASRMLTDNHVTVYRADIGEPMNLVQLEAHITSHIDKAHFCVAEVSTRNSNVLLEIGVATGCDKPVILMVQKGSSVPADLQGRYWLEYDPTQLDFVHERLVGFMRRALNDVLAAVDKNWYSVTAYRNRDTSPMLKLIAEARDQILVATTNLTWFVDRGAIAEIAKRLDNVPTLQVRILVLDPDSDFAGDRARQLVLSVRDFRRHLREALDKTVSTLSRFRDRCKIAEYSDFPTQITVIIDSTVLSGVVSAHRRGRDNIVFEVPIRNADVRESFLGHMRAVWERVDREGGGKLGSFLAT